jgi:hypothetical protein
MQNEETANRKPRNEGQRKINVGKYGGKLWCKSYTGTNAKMKRTKG